MSSATKGWAAGGSPQASLLNASGGASHEYNEFHCIFFCLGQTDGQRITCMSGVWLLDACGTSCNNGAATHS